MQAYCEALCAREGLHHQQGPASQCRRAAGCRSARQALTLLPPSRKRTLFSCSGAAGTCRQRRLHPGWSRSCVHPAPSAEPGQHPIAHVGACSTHDCQDSTCGPPACRTHLERAKAPKDLLDVGGLHVACEVAHVQAGSLWVRLLLQNQGQPVCLTAAEVCDA